jgi:hypothetical protein
VNARDDREVRIKLSAAQLQALETAGVFEEPLDADDETLAAAIQGHELVTREPDQIGWLIVALSDGADDYAEQRCPCPTAELRRLYRGDCQTFLRLARKLFALAKRRADTLALQKSKAPNTMPYP